MENGQYLLKIDKQTLYDHLPVGFDPCYARMMIEKGDWQSLSVILQDENGKLQKRLDMMEMADNLSEWDSFTGQYH